MLRLVVVPDLATMTVVNIRAWAQTQNIKAPSGLVKAKLIQYIQGVLTERRLGIPPGKFGQGPLSDLHYRIADPQLSWLQHLHTHGWAVTPVPNWNPAFTDHFLAWFAACTPAFLPHDPATWIPANLPVMTHGILKQYYGHTELQWTVRELCAPIFAQIFGCAVEDLLCAFDGGCFMPTIFQPLTAAFPRWIHNDSPRDYTSFTCVQGIVNFVDNGPEDGGLVLVEGSRDIFAEYMARHPSEGLMWGPSDQTDPLLSGRRLIKICAGPGQIILFDSRMFHCNAPAYGSVQRSDNTDVSPRYRFRMCHYVSMQPRVGATAKELENRCRLYEKGRMTGHWCYGPYFTATSEHPHTFGHTHPVKPPTIEIAPLRPLRRRLIGY